MVDIYTAHHEQNASVCDGRPDFPRLHRGASCGIAPSAAERSIILETLVGIFRVRRLLPFGQSAANEISYQHVLPQLTATAKTRRVYLGVCPEKNFTFTTALRPKIAFIIDIRRGNLDLQLMYKALFELSKDRAEFESRLFCRPRPQVLTNRSTPTVIFTAFKDVPSIGELRGLRRAFQAPFQCPGRISNVQAVPSASTSRLTHA